MKYVVLLFAFMFHTIHSMEPLDASDLEIIATEGITQLLRAVEANEFELVKSLLENKADPNESNTPTNPKYIGKFVDGKTPLTLAVANNNPKMVRLLLHHKANPDQPNRIGWTPLHVAYYFQHINSHLPMGYHFHNFIIIKLLSWSKNTSTHHNVGCKTPLEYADEFLHDHDEIGRAADSFKFEFANAATKYGYESDKPISKKAYVKILRLEQLDRALQESQITEAIYKQKKKQILKDYNNTQECEESSPEALLNILTTLRELKLKAAKNPAYVSSDEESDEEVETIESSPRPVENPKVSSPVVESLDSSPYPDTDEYETPISPKLNIKDNSSKFVTSKSKGTIRRALSSPQFEKPRVQKTPEQKHPHSPPILRRGLSFWNKKN